jgi:hypothetical protein
MTIKIDVGINELYILMIQKLHTTMNILDQRIKFFDIPD